MTRTKHYPGDVPCGRCEDAILPSETKFSGQDDDGRAIVLCEQCHGDAETTETLSPHEGAELLGRDMNLTGRLD